jgi:hypothetical protein
MHNNPYPGVNAHLNSLLQSPEAAGDISLWRSFHSQHIIHMLEALNALLPASYIALSDNAYQKPPDTSQSWMRAVIIREVTPEKSLGGLIARIELISPESKSDEAGVFTEAYATDRFNTLIDGAVLVEIDYLHESPSIMREMPAYPDHPYSYPYTILVQDMRPFTESGKAQVYGIQVDMALPRILLRLSEQESVAFDLNAVYQRTFQSGRWADLLDYGNPPLRFERYNRQDQARIQDITTPV